jgi:predicted HTH transcriptional regulator
MYQRVERGEIEQLCRETQLVECKKGLAESRRGCGSLCAMLNADTAKGLVMFGVDPNGTIVGLEPGDLDKAQRSLAQHLRDSLDPPIPVNVEVLECDHKFVLLLSAERPPTVPLVEYDGRALIREGSTTRRLSLGERGGIERRRARSTHPGPWTCDRCGRLAGIHPPTLIANDKGEPVLSYACSCGGEWWPAT